MITKKYYKLIRVSYADSDVFRVTNVSNTVGTLTVTRTNSSYADFEYSTDGVTWTSVTDWTNPLTVLVPAGGNVYMKGVASRVGPYDKSIKINMDVDHKIGGNILSLADKTNFSTMTTINVRIAGLFYGDTNLIDASEAHFGHLTTVGERTMSDMFVGCSSLIALPDYSTITSVGQSSLTNMAQSCTSLLATPDFSNINTIGSAGMNGMFYHCTSLTTAYAPNISNWTNISGWLTDVAASGTVHCPSQTAYDTIPSNSTGGVPSGWTKQLDA